MHTPGRWQSALVTQGIGAWLSWIPMGARMLCDEEVHMADTLSVYFPAGKKALRERLAKLARKRDRSVNYLVLKPIEAYLEKLAGDEA